MDFASSSSGRGVSHVPVYNPNLARTGGVKDDGRGLGEHFTGSHNDSGWWIPPAPYDCCVSKCCSSSLTISTWIMRSFCFPSLSLEMCTREQLVLPLYTEARRAGSASASPHPLSLCFLLHPSQPSCFPDVFIETLFFLAFRAVARLNSS